MQNIDNEGGVSLSAAPEVETEVAEAPKPKITVQPTVARRPGDNRTSDIARRKKLLEIYRAEEKVNVSVSPAYAKYVGKVMPLYLNGIFIAIKADGNIHEVPKSFADMWEERRRMLDYDIEKREKMADIANNIEVRPGELNI